MPLIASANRDADVFDRPDEFVFDRFANDAERQFTNAGKILPFGAGRHHCAGSQLARMEMLHGIAVMRSASLGPRSRGRGPQDQGFLLRSPDAVPVFLHQA